MCVRCSTIAPCGLHISGNFWPTSGVVDILIRLKRELLLLRFLDALHAVFQRNIGSTIHVETGIEDWLFVAVRMVRGVDTIAAVFAAPLRST